MNQAPLPLDEAVRIIRAVAPPPRAQPVALDDAVGRVLAEDLASLCDHPSLDNSALDGYACRVADTVDASAATRVRLRLVGEVPAGGRFDGRLGASEAIRIFTGGPMPEGADAIIGVEHTAEGNEAGERFVQLQRPASTAEVRRRAQDLAAGSTYLHAGRRLDAASVGLAAAMGHATIQVARRPHLALLTTGDEVVPPGQKLAPGQVYDSNGASLAALARAAGARVTRIPPVHDDLSAVQAVLDRALSGTDPIDLVVTSGGVSMGKYDFVRDLLLHHGETIFWKIAIRPGGPAMFGRYGALPVLGLPGNPVSSMVVFLLLGRAFTDTMLGRTDPIPADTRVPMKALSSFKSSGSKAGFQRAFLETVEAAQGGGPAVRSVDSQSSGILRSMAEAGALVRVPPHTDIAVGDTVDVIPLAAHLR